jgi:hypothetical protein
VVTEVLLDGYGLGYGTATFGDIEQGTTTVEFAVPLDLEQAALAQGVELRILSRGSVDAVVGAVLVEHLGLPDGQPKPPASEWLPIMGTGAAGRRAGVEVDASPERSGMVIQGPFWRLPAGAYEVRLRTRLPESSSGGAGEAGDSTPIAVLEAAVGESTLGRLALSRRDLGRAGMTLRFQVGPAEAEGDARVEVRLTTGTPVGFVVEGLSVARVGTPAALSG